MELAKAVKRTAEAIFERGGVIRSMENVGSRQLPYKMFKHGSRHEQGNYFIVNFDSPTTVLRSLSDNLHLDLDIVRPRILRTEEEISRPCKERPCDFGELTPENRKRLKEDLQKFIKKL